MQKNRTLKLAELVRAKEQQILDSWIKYQLAAVKMRSEFLTDAALRTISVDFLRLFQEASSASNSADINSLHYERVRKMLVDLSSARANQGFTPAETASFVFSLKRPIFDVLSAEISDPAELVDEIWAATESLDALGLFTCETYQRSREEIIKRQQREMLELSTPVIKLWDGILGLPLIGTLDSARTQIIMEALLQEIVDQGAKLAILDITGVPTVDTQTAQHLIKTVSAARLMGAECIISGIRPQIAQTIVHLGIDIAGISTKSTMADALREALAKSNWLITKYAPNVVAS